MSLQVFISYKSEYRDFARKVKNQIGQWGYGAWLDVDNIQPGEYFRHKIQEGLDGSEVLLMVLTEEAQLSREVMSEVDYFLDVRKKPVVPLLHQQCKPLYIFVSIQYIDFLADEANGFTRLKQRLNELAAAQAPVVTPAPVAPIVTEQKPTEVAEVSEHSKPVASPITLSDFIDDKVIDGLDYRNLELLKEQIRPFLGELLDRERFVLEMRFGLSDGKMHTLYEIAQVVGVAGERIRQLESVALRKLRDLSSSREKSEPAPIITEQKPEPEPTNAPVDAEQVHKPAPPKPSKKREEAASSVVVGKLEDEEAEAAMPDRLADTVEAEPAPAEDDDEYGVADEAQEKDAAAAFDDGVALPDLAPQAPPREPPKPAPITAPITAPAAQPAPITAPITAPAAQPAPITAKPPPPAPDAAAMGGAVPQPAPVGTPYTPSAPPAPQALYDRPSAPKSGSRLPIWALSAAAVLIVAVGVVALLPNLAALTPNVTETSPATSPLLLALGALVVGAVGVFVWRRSRRSSVGAAAPVSPVTELTNRRTMLDKVEEFWIRGVLDKALEAGQFEMGLAAAPGAVLRHVDYGDYPLPPNASIAQIFEDLNRELLILGAPGGGKTVLLLQLAEALIGQARTDDKKAVPVVFNLSSWAAGRKPLADWLVDELRLKYQVPKKVAQEWVEREQILPLLDGLDEVAEQYRNDCVEAINSFRQQYRAVDMAVCSRSADYDLLTSKLDVRGAVVLQPLDDDQINRFLDRPDLDGLRQVMKDDDELSDMTHTPFLLNSMAYAYAGASVNTLQIPTSDDMGKARRSHLFDRLVEKRLTSNPNEKYTTTKTMKWLGWLAGKMTTFKQTTLEIEGFQPEWIGVKRKNILGKLKIMLINTLAVGIGSGLLSAATLTVVSFVMVISDTLRILGYNSDLFRFVITDLPGRVASFFGIIVLGFISGLIPGTFIGIPISIRFLWNKELKTTDGIGWSWARFRWGGLIIGIMSAVILGLISAIFLLLPILTSNYLCILFGGNYRFCLQLEVATETEISEAIQFVLKLGELLTRNLQLGIGVGFISGFIAGGMLSGFTGKSFEQRTVPNQGIRRSFTNSFRFGLLSNVVFGISWSVLLYVTGSDLGVFDNRLLGWPFLFLVLVIIMVIGFVVALRLGGSTVIKHATIRFLLWRSGDAPLNYARFLDYCASAGLLRKVGGGYIFVHRYLLEYFAGLE